MKPVAMHDGYLLAYTKIPTFPETYSFLKSLKL